MSQGAPVEQALVVGSGPAGYTAALYLARAELSPLVVEGISWGGLLQETTTVENYPGFLEGVEGPELMMTMRSQAERFGARLVSDLATEIELSRSPGTPHSVTVGDDKYRAWSVILAMGAQHRRLGVAGEELLGGRGVSYCATCDAPFFRGKDTCVVGGGDTAMEEAIFLARFARTVTVVHRRRDFRASPVMLGRAHEIPNIELLTPYVVEEFTPSVGGLLGSVSLIHAEDGSRVRRNVEGAFVAVGHVPQSDLVNSQIVTDEHGYIRVVGRSTATGVPGVFAAGDIADPQYRQAVTAAGSGCQAALDATAYLGNHLGAVTGRGGFGLLNSA